MTVKLRRLPVGITPGWSANRVVGRFHDMLRDQRWDDVITLRVLSLPAGRNLDNLDSDRVTALARQFVPGGSVVLRHVDEVSEQGMLSLLHREVYQQGGLVLNDLIILVSPGYIGIAHSHSQGDGFTADNYLRPLYAYFSATKVPNPAPMRRTLYELPILLDLAARTFTRAPLRVLRFLITVVAQHGQDVGTRERTRTDYDQAQAGYTILKFTWPESADQPPKATHLVARWGQYLDSELPEGTINHNQEWFIVGLRPLSSALTTLGGNLAIRMRLVQGATPDHTAKLTRERFRSGIPVIRAALSAGVQLIRQIGRLGAVTSQNRGRVTSPSGVAPTKRIEITWSHSRISDQPLLDNACVAGVPGNINVTLREKPTETALVLVTFLPKELEEKVITATTRLMVDAGYRELNISCH